MLSILDSNQKDPVTTWGKVVYDDLSDEFLDRTPRSISIDLETGLCDFDDPLFFMKANPHVITIYNNDDGSCEFIRVNPNSTLNNLRNLVGNTECTYFHHAYFDMSFLAYHFDIKVVNPRCTYILSRVLKAEGLLPVKASLKPMLTHFLGYEPTPRQALSDWTADVLSPVQQAYAHDDVAYLYSLYDAMKGELWKNALHDYHSLISTHENHLYHMVEARCLKVVGLFEYLKD